MSEGKLAGVVGTPVTPFTPDLELDTAALERLVDFHVTHGAHVLALPMHIGESLNVTIEERKTMAEVAVKAADRRIPVLVHVSLPGTSQVVELARHAESVGADGVVVVTPYHWRPGPEALLAHFGAVADAVEIDVLLYNFPARLGVAVTPDLVLRLVARHPNVVGMKDATYDMQAFTEMARTVSGAAPDFALFTGVEYPLPGMVLGGAGCFSPSLQLAPCLVRALYEASRDGDLAAALPLQRRASALWHLLKDGYPASVKAALGIMGRAVGGVRSPLSDIGPATAAALEEGLGALGVLSDEPQGW